MCKQANTTFRQQCTPVSAHVVDCTIVVLKQISRGSKWNNGQNMALNDIIALKNKKWDQQIPHQQSEAHKTRNNALDLFRHKVHKD